MTPGYRGRFAPSPTGPLHFGSLLAAISSYATARQQHGKWLVRIEDVDLLRCNSESTTLILNTLEHYGLYWDEDILYQSQRDEAYQSALEKLNAEKLSYGCACSRKTIRENTHSANTPLIYPGTCRHGIEEGKTASSTRLRTNDQEIQFQDKIQGHYIQKISEQVGDFILKRTDNLFAYQLAVVVDDEEQGITDIVRGSDMLDSTPRQILLQQYLGYATPSYCHIPLATNSQGGKLSKQNMATPISTNDPRPEIINALTFLNQSPPSDLQGTNLESIWEWVFQHWSAKKIPAKLSITYNDDNE